MARGSSCACLHFPGPLGVSESRGDLEEHIGADFEYITPRIVSMYSCLKDKFFKREKIMLFILISEQ